MLDLYLSEVSRWLGLPSCPCPSAAMFWFPNLREVNNSGFLLTRKKVDITLLFYIMFLVIDVVTMLLSCFVQVSA